MNFLLHHHLALRDTARLEAAVGAMLPDVWRMADRRAHVRPPRAPVPTADEGHQEISAVIEGIAHHVAIDAWFHETQVFRAGQSAAREALRRARGAPKMALLAHITWELCLDGALLRRVGTEPVLQALRASIGAARPDAHHRAAGLHTALRPDERPRFEVRVDEILDAIARGPWVARYATASGIVELLDGVRARLGLAAVVNADRDAVAAALESLEGDADVGLEEILSRAPAAREARPAS